MTAIILGQDRYQKPSISGARKLPVYCNFKEKLASFMQRIAMDWKMSKMVRGLLAQKVYVKKVLPLSRTWSYEAVTYLNIFCPFTIFKFVENELVTLKPQISSMDLSQ